MNFFSIDKSVAPESCESFSAELLVQAPLDLVFDFFSDAKNLEKITPPFVGFQILSMNTPKIEKGTEITYRIRLRGLPLKWKTLISVWEPPYKFVDLQLAGPYRYWHHTHTFEAQGANATLIRDRVDYCVPFGGLGKLVAGRFVRGDVQRIFAYRTEIIKKQFS